MQLYRVQLACKITAYVRAESSADAILWADHNADEIASTEGATWDVWSNARPLATVDDLRDGWEPEAMCYGDHQRDITCQEAIEEENGE